MKTKKTKAPSPSTVPDNPYLAARREWLERYGTYINRERSWRLVAILAVATALVAVLGIAYIGSQSRITPYVVEVDKLGQAVAVRPAMAARTPPDRVLQAQLARWVTDVRSVYLDPTAQRKMLDEAYAMVDANSVAKTTLNDWYRQHNPFKRAGAEVVSIHIDSLPARISKDTWRVEWTETRHSRGQGEQASAPKRWAAVITVAVVPPTSEATILVNPSGMYIRQFTWSRSL